jgi:aryl-alcohol dehydrogenase-like predicted oxidoreductase
VRALNRGATLLRRIAPPVAPWLPAPRAALAQFGMFALPDIRQSLETSLRKLRTDYLDIFLLHECTLAEVGNAELQYFLQGLQKAGKIRAFGLATGIDETIRIMESRPALGNVIQIPNNIWDGNIERLPLPAKGRTITHSSLTARFHALTEQLRSDAALASKWRSAVQIDPTDKVEMAKLLLAHALHENPGGVVLFFSSKRENVRAGAQVATEAKFDPAQMRALKAMVKNSAELRA